MSVAPLPPGGRRVPCNSQISRNIQAGKHVGGAEEKLLEEEYVNRNYEDIMIEPLPSSHHQYEKAKKIREATISPENEPQLPEDAVKQPEAPEAPESESPKSFDLPSAE